MYAAQVGQVTRSVPLRDRQTLLHKRPEQQKEASEASGGLPSLIIQKTMTSLAALAHSYASVGAILMTLLAALALHYASVGAI